MDDLKDDQIRATLFKDVNILYWLYPELNSDDFPEEKEKSWFKKLWRKVKSLTQ